MEGTHIAYVGAERPEGGYDEFIDCSGKVMLPGLVNAHTHLPMTLMRGYAGGPRPPKLAQRLHFSRGSQADDRAVAAGAALGLAEMIASGVTCAADMYMRTGVIARQVLDVGISANLSCGGVYFGPPQDFSPEDCSDCKNQQALTRQWHGAGDGQILVDASIHAEYTSSPRCGSGMADFARIMVCACTRISRRPPLSNQGSLERRGLTPIQALDRCGVWENGGIAAHCVTTTAEDWAIMAAKDVSAVHNPWSNLKLGSGVAPIPDMLRAG